MSKEYETATEKLEALMDGSYYEDENESEEVEEEVVNDEDTDLEEDVEESDDVEDDTNDQIDGDDEDTDGDTDDEGTDELEENAPVDDDNGEEPANDTSNEETEGADPVENQEPEDYQKKYEELLAESEKTRKFYDKVTSEFVANGKVVKGYTDPDKIIKSQQALHGLEQKMAVFKKHKPLLRALQESGMVDDTSKFDLAMSIMNGDKEALKQHMKNLNVDPMDLDMEEVAYEEKTFTASPLELALDDAMFVAKNRGVDDKFSDVIANGWDRESSVQLLQNPRDSEILIDHMQSGIYDAVQERIAEKSRLDLGGSFNNSSDYEKYMIASRELENEYIAMMKQEEEAKRAGSVNAEKTKINETRDNEDYKEKARAREEQARLAREKASRVSKPKRKPRKTTKKKPDMMSLTGDAFMDVFNKEILGIN